MSTITLLEARNKIKAVSILAYLVEYFWTGFVSDFLLFDKEKGLCVFYFVFALSYFSEGIDLMLGFARFLLYCGFRYSLWTYFAFVPIFKSDSIFLTLFKFSAKFMLLLRLFKTFLQLLSNLNGIILKTYIPKFMIKFSLFFIFPL